MPFSEALWPLWPRIHPQPCILGTRFGVSVLVGSPGNVRCPFTACQPRSQVQPQHLHPCTQSPPPPLSSPSTTPRLCSLPVPTAWFSSCHFSFSKPHSVASRAPAPPPLCTCAPAALNHAPCTHHIPSSEAALPSAYLPSTPSSRPTHLPSILLKSGALFCQEGPTPSILEKPFLSQENATDRAR